MTNQAQTNIQTVTKTRPFKKTWTKK